MLDFKNIIADELKKVTNIENISQYIEIPTKSDMGDYSLPCFKLAKELKKAPKLIATEIKDKLNLSSDIVEKVDVVNGYLNFYVNSQTQTKSLFEVIIFQPVLFYSINTPLA